MQIITSTQNNISSLNKTTYNGENKTNSQKGNKEVTDEEIAIKEVTRKVKEGTEER